MKLFLNFTLFFNFLFVTGSQNKIQYINIHVQHNRRTRPSSVKYNYHVIKIILNMMNN